MELSKLKKFAHDLILSEGSKKPLIVYGSLSSQSLWLIRRFEKMNAQDFQQIVFDQSPLPDPIVGFLNFENLRHGNLSDSLIFRVVEGYEFDFSLGAVKSLTDQGDANDVLNFFNQRKSLEHFTDVVSISPERAMSPDQDILLEVTESDQEYLSKVSQVLRQIKDGRFYQMNLLRRFRLKNTNRQMLLQKWLQDGGSQGALLFLDKLEIFSFSPEHFVTLRPENPGFSIHTSPIKGTIERGSDNGIDDSYRQQLQASEKDRAELSMIVDLMRNDLRRIAKPFSVKVTDPGSVQTYSTLHHLVAQLEAEAVNNLKMSDLLEALFPAGSITGAPKIEVMKAIEEFENVPRNFFMGSAFKVATSKHFESTVMIRTVVKNEDEYLYAAGSGIVIKSQPEKELKEIEVKCRVLTGA